MKDWFDEHIKHFKWDEFGPRPEKNNKLLMLAMDKLRDISETPIIIHCTWDDGGHSEKSYHYTGNACDFHFFKHRDFVQQYEWIKMIPEFKGIGFYPQWNNVGWHVDLRDKMVKWTQINGRYIYIEKIFDGVIKNAR